MWANSADQVHKIYILWLLATQIACQNVQYCY